MSERLLLDMDGVLADTMGGVFSRLDEMGYDHVTHADIDEYWFKGAPVEASVMLDLSLIHISEPTRPCGTSRMPSSA